MDLFVKQNKVKLFVKYYRPLLKKFLVPMSLIDDMPSLNHEAVTKIHEAANAPHQQVQILLSTLEECNDEGMLYEFLDAIRFSRVFDENDQEENVDGIFTYSERVDEIAKLLDLLRPQFQNIRVAHCLDALSPMFADHEKDSLNQILEKHGNHCTLWWLFRVLVRKEKGWIKEFYEFVKDQNYASSNSCESLAQVIFDFFDFEPDAVFKPSVEVQHHENGFTASSGDSVVTKGENVQNDISPLNFGQAKDSNEGLKFSVQPSDADQESVDLNLLTSHENIAEIPTSKNNLLPLSSDTHLEINPNSTEDTRPKDVAVEFPLLRNYQKELVELALSGENVIICAPPGAGKTIVAAYIIKNYLETREDTKKPALFFTPGGALAYQQYQRLEGLFSKKYRVSLCRGSSESARLELHVGSDIIVLTPQLLANALWNKAKENPIKSIGQYGLLVLDECHHCLGIQLPYNNMMQEYMNLKSNLPSNQRLPRVVGLTATMGVGKAAEPSKLILQVCANVDAQAGIVTVRKKENVEELNKHIPQPTKEIISLPKRENNAFYKRLISFIDQIIKIAQDYFAVFSNRKPPPYQEHIDNFGEMMQWSSGMKRLVVVNDDKNSRNVISCLEYFEVCVEAKDVYLKCHPLGAVRELEAFKKDKKEHLDCLDKVTDIEMLLCAQLEVALTDLEKLASDERCVNPNLKKIERILVDKFEREKDSLGMLMVQKIKYSRAIAEWINENENLKHLNAQHFTGIAGMSHKTQAKIMQAFRERKHKVLVSTPQAAGEGIDVPDCNIIINYDFKKSEVEGIQVIGRARRKGGEIFEISSSEILKHDELNFQKTILMYKAIGHVQDMAENNTEEYHKQISELQNESRKAYQVAMLAKLCERPQQTDGEYSLHCFKCDVFVCSSLDVRKVENNQHVIAVRSFKEKYVLKEHPSKEKDRIPDWQKLYKLACQECRFIWGTVASWENRLTLPIIQIRGFRTRDAEGVVEFRKQWRDCVFKPIEANLNDILIDMFKKPDQETDQQ